MPYDPKDWPENQYADWDPTPFLQGDRTGHGRKVIVDIEGNGLLYDQGAKKRGDMLWCIGVIDMETREKFYWGVDLGEDSLDDAMEFLAQCDLMMAHHGIYYDYPYLRRWSQEKRGREWQPKGKHWDSEIIAKCVWPMETLIGPDLKRIREGKMPGNMLKRHSLAAWGYRTGTHKTDYSGGFDQWNPAMAVYLMTGDLDGPLALWDLIKKKIGWSEDTPEGSLVWPELSLDVENSVAAIIFQQQEYGVRFDRERALALTKDLTNQRKALEDRLVELFGSWWQPLDDPETGRLAGSTMNRKLVGFEDVTVPRYGKTGKELKPYVGPPMEEITEGSASVRIEYVTYNPSSRDHLAQRLAEVYGWKPKAFGKDGKPTVDETTLEAIPDSVMPADVRQTILDYFVVNKTLGTLSKGRKSWLNMAGEDDRIHGEMDTVGAVTRRGTHKNPNLSGTPSVLKEDLKDASGAPVLDAKGKKIEVVVKGLRGRYGWECRELFTADEGWELTGIDASSLELIDLGHYLYPMDDGAFSSRVCDPKRDAHKEHGELCGMLRADAKTTIYLKVYGGSAYKLSLAISVTDDEVPALLGYKGLPMLLRSLAKRFDDEFVRKLDDHQKARIAKARQIIIKLEGGIAGLKDLITNVQGAAGRGWLKAMDGSRIHVRKPHAALNSLLQSAGALSCKLWIHLVHQELERRGLKIGVDWKQVLWVHDEIQITHRPGLGPLVAEVAEECMVKAGELLGLRGRYRTDAKTGANWAMCH